MAEIQECKRHAPRYETAQKLTGLLEFTKRKNISNTRSFGRCDELPILQPNLLNPTGLPTPALPGSRWLSRSEENRPSLARHQTDLLAKILPIYAQTGEAQQAGIEMAHYSASRAERGLVKVARGGRSQQEHEFLQGGLITSRHIEDAASYEGLWKALHRLGYVTLYHEWNEEGTWLGTFQQFRSLQGFRNPPTDHYNRAFQAEQEYLRDIWLEYPDKPKFFFYIDAFYTHASNELSAIDHELLEFLKWTQSSEVQNNTLFILMSDHASFIYSPEEGEFRVQMESRSPLLHISYPPWMTSDAIASLKINAKERLVTTFDLHRTLTELPYMFSKSKTVPGPKPLPCQVNELCYNIFQEIPKTRSCADAGIQPPWCGCVEPLLVEEAEKNKVVELCSQKALILINSHLKASRLMLEHICEPWRLVEVVSSWVYGGPGMGNHSKHFHFTYDPEMLTKSVAYSAIIKAQPGSTPFQITFRYKEKAEDPCSMKAEFKTEYSSIFIGLITALLMNLVIPEEEHLQG
ncbi:unnamed protein product [Notodromas monacha]|uniref:Uncharacterized protein n=1 Tax=Notodromas monacha TaxID=399045 RepID=A0A7R9BS81_9CRUS|nr:unnamed protein product [Notodromas monacha]CAG0920407.1 unnamed protein product [Notodromas monacha]